MGNTIGVYKEKFAKGTAVRIANRAFLEDFRKTWKFHHALEPEQLGYENKIATVKAVGFYHGGDPLYELEGVPGIWHEQCLTAELNEKARDEATDTWKKRSAVWWIVLVVFVLIPIPFGHWWLTVASLIVCVLLALLLTTLD